MYVVGSPASAACLHHHKGSLVRVELAAFECIYELPYYQQSRVTGVIVGVAQPLVYYPPACGGEEFHLVAVVVEHLFQQTEMDGKHIGDEYGVFLAHFLCKEEPPCLVIYKFCHVIAPIKTIASLSADCIKLINTLYHMIINISSIFAKLEARC